MQTESNSAASTKVDAIRAILEDAGLGHAEADDAAHFLANLTKEEWNALAAARDA